MSQISLKREATPQTNVINHLFVVTIALYCAVWYPPTFTPMAAEKKLFL